MLDSLPILSILIWMPIIGGLILLFLNSISEKYIRVFGHSVSLATLVLSIIILNKFDADKYYLQFTEKFLWISNFDIFYYLAIDGFSLVFIILTTITTSLILIFSFSENRAQNNKFISLFLILEGLLIGVFSAFDSILFYIFFESMLIPLFLIIGIWGGSNRIYATLKFFIYTFVGSVLMLISLIYLSNQANSFNIVDFYNLNLPLETQIYIFLAFLVAFGIKIPMWPVHTWLPDAHVEAPSSGSVILAAVLLKVGGYGLIRFLLPITSDAGFYLNSILITLSLIAIIYISFVALAQKDMKKLIAYSSVAHMGFVTLGIFLAFNIVKPGIDKDILLLGLQGSVMQMISHGLISAGLFFCIGIIYARTKNRAIDDQSGIGQVMPLFSAMMMFFLLSNAGLPGTSGFVGEFMVMIAGLEVSYLYAFLASMTLILAASYSLWLGKRVLFGLPSNDNINNMSSMKNEEFWPLMILILFIILLGVKPGIILDISLVSSEYMIGVISGDIK